MNAEVRQGDPERAYDVVLFGATGFVGALTAEYLAEHAPTDCRWALAGRDLGKLERLRERLTALDPACADLPLLRADARDTGALGELAASTRVLATTVGPYIWHGAELVAACAEAGTDYLDLTGEPEFVDRTYVEHDARARETGARIVHACGFDSIPADLGTYYTVNQLPEGVPLRVDGFLRSNALFSGGTLASALTAIGRGPQTLAAAHTRRLHEPRLLGRRARGPWAPRASAARPAPGPCRYPYSTPGSSPAPRPPWTATARTSATGTTPPSSTSPWPWAVRRPSARPPPWPSSRPRGAG